MCLFIWKSKPAENRCPWFVSPEVLSHNLRSVGLHPSNVTLKVQRPSPNQTPVFIDKKSLPFPQNLLVANYRGFCHRRVLFGESIDFLDPLCLVTTQPPTDSASIVMNMDENFLSVLKFIFFIVQFTQDIRNNFFGILIRIYRKAIL